MRFHSLTLLVAAVMTVLALCLFAPSCAQRSAQSIAIAVDQPGAAISPSMFGVFFEDINFAADSGIYPERVKNRSFEFTEPLAGWSKIDNFEGDGQLYARSEGGLNEDNPHYLRVHIVDPDGLRHREHRIPRHGGEGGRGVHLLGVGPGSGRRPADRPRDARRSRRATSSVRRP